MSHTAAVGPNHKTGNVTFADLFDNVVDVTLNGATAVTTADTGVTSSSKFIIAYKTPAGTPSPAYVSAISAGVSFSLKATASDTSVVTVYRLG